MTEQIRRISDDDKFSEMFHGGASRLEIAKHFGVNVRVINSCVEFLGWRPPTENDKAPTPDEDRISRESLALAPSVAARAKKFWEQHLSERRNESEAATFKRIWDWQNTQLDSTYRVILCRNRDLE